MDGVVPVRLWTFTRGALALAWLATSVRVAIPDYPYGASFWDFLIRDVGGLQHELAYIAAVFISLITLTYFWEERSEKAKRFGSPRERRLRASK